MVKEYSCHLHRDINNMEGGATAIVWDYSCHLHRDINNVEGRATAVLMDYSCHLHRDINNMEGGAMAVSSFLRKDNGEMNQSTHTRVKNTIDTQLCRHLRKTLRTLPIFT